MVKPVQKAEINSFVKGLISEASPINFPPDASLQEENFELNRNGSRNRRYGMDFEQGHTLRTTWYGQPTIGGVATSSYRWIGAGNSPDAEFVVVQFGNHIDVYQEVDDAISNTGFIASIVIPNAGGDKPFSYAAVDGKLIVASGFSTVSLIEWNGTSLSLDSRRLLVRDLWGIPDLDNSLANLRPTVLTDYHLYNLRNQGWGIPRKDSNGVLRDPIAIYHGEVVPTNSTANEDELNLGAMIDSLVMRVSSSTSTTPGLNVFPSNVETVITGLQFQANGSSPYERMFTNLYDEQLGLNEPAAKGYFIIDALNRGASRASEEANNRAKYPTLSYSAHTFKADQTQGGATLVTDYAGRVFYAGFNGEIVDPEENSPNLANYVLFSQVVRGKDEFVKCYQEGDPTSREGSDIVDTDGGYIRISGAKKIIGLKAISGGLFVIADNGVWRISGGAENGFTATNYKVDKVSTFGGISEKSIVEVNDSIFYWGEEGIFTVARNQYGDYLCNSISQSTIQSIYDSIDINDKKSVVGAYDQSDKKIRWLYGVNKDVTSTQETCELVLDMVLSAFTINRIYNLVNISPRVVGYIHSPSSSYSTTVSNIDISGNQVVVGGDQVTETDSVSLKRTTALKYITIQNTDVAMKYSFSHYNQEGFRDWKSVDGVGVDAKAFLMTGALTAGDSSVYKQVPYIIMHFKMTEKGVVNSDGELIPYNPSSCMMRSQWNWATSVNSGNWGNMFQAYRHRRPLFITDSGDDYDAGFETVVTKNKLRGRGRALSLYMETEPDKDCIILGWNLSLTGNSLT